MCDECASKHKILVYQIILIELRDQSLLKKLLLLEKQDNEIKEKIWSKWKLCVPNVNKTMKFLESRSSLKNVKKSLDDRDKDQLDFKRINQNSTKYVTSVKKFVDIKKRKEIKQLDIVKMGPSLLTKLHGPSFVFSKKLI
jgi:hypothetical protein